MRKSCRVSAWMVVMSLALAGCSSREDSQKTAKLDPFAGVGSPYYKGKGPIPFGGGHYQLGKPYQVAGRWFTPHEQPDYDRTGLSSWYGEAFHRRMTSNGEWFDMATLTAAHATLPLPSYAQVTNLQNGKTIIVRINDRGPFVDTRVLDVSKRVAEILGYKQQGTAKVRVQYIGPAPLNDKGSHLMAMNRELKRGTSLDQMIAAANGADRGNYQVAEVKTPRLQRARYVAQEQPLYDEGAGLGLYYFVQVGSFADPDNAERIREQLSGLGQVQVAEVNGAAGPLYRVRLGPFQREERANSALNQVYNLDLPDARLIQVPLQQASLQ